MDVQQRAELALTIVERSRIISIDVETTGLDWKRNFVVGWVIGDEHDCVYVPVRHGGGGNLPGVRTPDAYDSPVEVHPFETKLAQALKGNLLVGHNIKFDAHFALNHGVKFGREMVCTMNTQTLLNEYTRSYSLDSVAKSYGVTAKLGDQLYRHIATKFGCKPDRSAMQHYWKLSGSDPIAIEYAEGDGITTLELYNKQVNAIQDQELDQIWELENDLIWTLVRMERRGFRVDPTVLKALVTKAEEEIERCNKLLPPDFNPRSPAQVKAYVEQYRTDWPTTGKGNPSFPESFLSSFPEGQLVLEPRKWTNMISKFVNPLLEVFMFDERIHANYTQNRTDEGGTISGRLACSHPNLQAFPKHDKKFARLVREAFIADEGFTLYEGDYAQIEPRLYAHYSGDENLMRGYTSDPPIDVHTMAAELMNKDRATVAKRMNMGMFTGMFPPTFSVHMGMPLSEAKVLWDQWHATFPKVGEFQRLAKNVLLRRGYIKTILGRRCRLEAPKWAYRGVSKIIQGGNADIVKHKLVVIDNWLEAMGDPAHILGTIHDSLIWQAPDSQEGDNISETLVHVMEDNGPPIDLKVPMVVDVGKGRTWADASFG